MSEPAASYLSIDLRAYARRQAIIVWSITSAVLATWLALILAPPLLLAYGAISFASPIYEIFGYICHQMTDRSLHIAGHQMAVCSRCFGVYSGLAVGVLIYPLWRRVEEVDTVPRFWLFAALIPVTIDWSLTVFGVWENTHLSRFVTGAILGVACGTFILPALVDITRNLFSGRGRTAEQ